MDLELMINSLPKLLNAAVPTAKTRETGYNKLNSLTK